MFKEYSKSLKTNWKAGLTVALVSIPLSVSLAVASQTTPVVGIITAIWAGLIAAIFGGSNFNIVGPTGALSGLIAAFVISHGADQLPSLAVISGLIILAAFALKLEKYLVFVPANTIHGFTLGVAFIIALNQANYALGITGLKAHEKFIDNVVATFSNLHMVSPVTFAMFIVFFLALLAFLKLTPKVPGAIILAPIGILLGYLSQNELIPIKLQTLGMKFSDIQPALFQPFKLSFSYDIMVASVVIALIAILETMISAKIADGMTKTKHNKRKEMLGLGLANIVAGIAGGMPATAALARTSLNIKTKATHKTSAIISSVSVAVISVLFLQYFKYIPMAAIAAILVYVALRMIEFHHFKKMYEVDKKSFFLAMLVAAVTIYEDPIVGILLGAAISLLIFVEQLSRGQFELVMNSKKNGMEGKIVGDSLDGEEVKVETDTLVYTFHGILAYMNGQAHVLRFENNLGEFKNIVLRLRNVYFVDMDGVEALDEIIEVIKAQKRRVLVTGASPLVEEMLEQSHEYQKLLKEGKVFEKTTDALAHLGHKLN